MNLYLKMQIQTMLSSVEAFEKGCDLAAVKDDGKVDAKEARMLRRLHKAASDFRTELERCADENEVQSQ